MRPAMQTDDMRCYCGHDCSRCITYLATVGNDDDLRRQSQAFYQKEFGWDIPLEDIHCSGGRSDDRFRYSRGCPFQKCCIQKKLDGCTACGEYPCRMLADYQRKYVNKCNQLPDTDNSRLH